MELHRRNAWRGHTHATERASGEKLKRAGTERTSRELDSLAFAGDVGH